MRDATADRPHRHSPEDEFTDVLEGSVGVRLGDEKFQAQQGAYQSKPRGYGLTIDDDWVDDLDARTA